jgi:hypothetical protein
MYCERAAAKRAGRLTLSHYSNHGHSVYPELD